MVPQLPRDRALQSIRRNRVGATGKRGIGFVIMPNQHLVLFLMPQIHHSQRDHASHVA